MPSRLLYDMDPGNSNPGPRACVGRTLPPEPSPQPGVPALLSFTVKTTVEKAWEMCADEEDAAPLFFRPSSTPLVDSCHPIRLCDLWLWLEF